MAHGNLPSGSRRFGLSIRSPGRRYAAELGIHKVTLGPVGFIYLDSKMREVRVARAQAPSRLASCAASQARR